MLSIPRRRSRGGGGGGDVPGFEREREKREKEVDEEEKDGGEQQQQQELLFAATKDKRDAVVFSAEASTSRVSNPLSGSTNNTRASRRGAIGVRAHRREREKKSVSMPRSFVFLVRRDKISQGMGRGGDDGRDKKRVLVLSLLSPRIPRSSCDRQESLDERGPALSRERPRRQREGRRQSKQSKKTKP